VWSWHLSATFCTSGNMLLEGCRRNHRAGAEGDVVHRQTPATWSMPKNGLQRLELNGRDPLEDFGHQGLVQDQLQAKLLNPISIQVRVKIFPEMAITFMPSEAASWRRAVC